MNFRRIVFCGALASAGAPAFSDGVETLSYRCDGPDVTATYVGEGADNVAFLLVEGEKFGLSVSPSGSGVRYAGEGFVWHIKGDAGTLMREDDTGKITTISICDVLRD